MFKDAFESLKLAVIERTTSPLLGVFITSWLTFNWKVVAVIVWGSGMQLDERIAHINAILMEDVIFPNGVNFPSHLYGPLLFTFLFLFLYPIASLVPFIVWKLADTAKVKVVEWCEKNRRLSVPQSRRAWQAAEEIANSQNSTIDNYRRKHRQALEDIERIQREQHEVEQRYLEKIKGRDELIAQLEIAATKGNGNGPSDDLQMIINQLKAMEAGEREERKASEQENRSTGNGGLGPAPKREPIRATRGEAVQNADGTITSNSYVKNDEGDWDLVSSKIVEAD